MNDKIVYKFSWNNGILLFVVNSAFMATRGLSYGLLLNAVKHGIKDTTTLEVNELECALITRDFKNQFPYLSPTEWHSNIALVRMIGEEGATSNKNMFSYKDIEDIFIHKKGTVVEV